MDLDAGSLNIPYADKIVHFIFYSGFSFLGSLSMWERSNGKHNLVKRTRKILFLTIAYGILIEVLQYTFTTDRMAEFGDVLANTMGALVGIGVYRWFFSKKNPLKWKF